MPSPTEGLASPETQYNPKSFARPATNVDATCLTDAAAAYVTDGVPMDPLGGKEHPLDEDWLAAGGEGHKGKNRKEVDFQGIKIG